MFFLETLHHWMQARSHDDIGQHEQVPLVPIDHSPQFTSSRVDRRIDKTLRNLPLDNRLLKSQMGLPLEISSIRSHKHWVLRLIIGNPVSCNRQASCVKSLNNRLSISG
jgi:hypothetical protein